MKPSLIQKIVNAILLLGPIVGAFVAAAAVRASEPVQEVAIIAVDFQGEWGPGAGSNESGSAAGSGEVRVTLQ